MNIDKVIKYFGSQAQAAAAIGCSQPAISNWKSRGHIPELQQLRIEHVTKGKLKAQAHILKSTKRKVSRP
jgi:DNA-binding transcriptional regulator YdaS (Cro superfamily)